MKILSLLFAPIKWVFKFLLKCTLVLALLLVIILACGNLWLPRVASWQIRSLTGFDTTIQSSRGSLFRGYVDFRDMSIKNPAKQFNESTFISFNDLGVDIDMTSIFKDTIVFESIVLDIDSITVVKNAEGDHNYSVFIEKIGESKNNKDSGNEKPKASTVAKTSEKKKKPEKNFTIDKLVLSIRSVKTIDESTGTVKEYPIKYRREFSNVSAPSSLVAPLVADLSVYGLGALIQSTIKSIGELPGVEQIKDGLTKVKDVSTDTVKNIGSKVKGIFSK